MACCSPAAKDRSAVVLILFNKVECLTSRGICLVSFNKDMCNVMKGSYSSDVESYTVKLDHLTLAFCGQV